MNQFYKNLALWLVIGMILIALFNIFNQPLSSQSDVIFSDFMNQVENGQITEVTIQGDRISGKYVDGSSFQTMTPPKDQDLVRILREKGGSYCCRATRANKLVHENFDFLVPNDFTSWNLDIFYAANAIWWGQSFIVW